MSFRVFYYKVWQRLLQSVAGFHYYKVWQRLLQSVASRLLQSVASCYYKVWQVLQSVAEFITKCGRYYKVWQLLQSVAQQSPWYSIGLGTVRIFPSGQSCFNTKGVISIFLIFLIFCLCSLDWIYHRVALFA